MRGRFVGFAVEYKVPLCRGLDRRTVFPALERALLRPSRSIIIMLVFLFSKLFGPRINYVLTLIFEFNYAVSLYFI